LRRVARAGRVRAAAGVRVGGRAVPGVRRLRDVDRTRRRVAQLAGRRAVRAGGQSRRHARSAERDAVVRAPVRTILLMMLAGCAGVSGPQLDDPGAGANGLYRDYLTDGKFDELGHPFNARVVEAEKFCHGVGRALTRRFEATAADGAGVMCAGELPGSQQTGELVLNLRVAAAHFQEGATLLTARVLD